MAAVVVCATRLSVDHNFNTGGIGVCDGIRMSDMEDSNSGSQEGCDSECYLRDH